MEQSVEACWRYPSVPGADKIASGSSRGFPTDSDVTGDALTIWSVRAATLLYVAALVILLTAGASGRRRIAKLAWTAGCLFYLAHVYWAFEHVHGWSHDSAYLQTARQTSELFGIDWGGGLYLNYLFTVIWTIDVAWWWLRQEHYENRRRWLTAAIHSFLGFLFFNGTVVFAAGFSRWVGALATPALLFLWWRSRTQTAKARQDP